MLKLFIVSAWLKNLCVYLLLAVDLSDSDKYCYRKLRSIILNRPIKNKDFNKNCKLSQLILSKHLS